MRKDTAEKAANLLASVAITLRNNGRPRKRPGYWRDDAQTSWGSSVRPTHPNAVKWSLYGALLADAKALGYSRSVVHRAIEALIHATDDQSWYWRHGSPKQAAVHLDDDYYDTRHIVRLCTKAQRTAEKVAA